eukprot:TRINITY_DN9353_c0_g1_i1.p1 TRINITY_DN9353_c0_g1~~TRINITY_DN9353_c0_g1_i1.p1  ORF type:complete len:542 (-),score=194.84 TRINITY_DN9353_c0_g1_i1:164-1789(-)
MSTIYVTEPMTRGKVVLKTTVGDIDIELWSKEAPKAVRNFIQLAMEGFFDGNPFHRVVPGFLAQTGGGKSGNESESIYGGPFADEFHSRLRFNHRGIVAQATSSSNSNSSQFFITLDKCEGLERKNTIFGKVTGDTIFNVLKMNEYDIGEDERPMYPAKIIKVEILWDPFEDIVPRVIEKPAIEAPKVKAIKQKPVKNTTLLSFGDDEEGSDKSEEDVPKIVPKIAPQMKMKSSHHFSEDPVVQELAQQQEFEVQQVKEYSAQQVKKKLEEAKKKLEISSAESGDAKSAEEKMKDFGKSMLSKVQSTRKQLGEITEEDEKRLALRAESTRKRESDSSSDSDSSYSSSDEDNKDPNKKSFKRLKLRKIAPKPKVEEEPENGAQQKTQPEVTNYAPSRYSGSFDTPSSRPTKRIKRDPSHQQKTLDRLAKFKASLAQKKKNVSETLTQDPSKIVSDAADHNSRSFRLILDEADNDEDDKNWVVHKLAFTKLPSTDAMSRNEDDHYDVYDPLEDPLKRGRQNSVPSNKHERHLARLGSKNNEKW